MLNNVLGVLGTPTPPVTNSYESIQTFTVGAGGQASITFGSGGTIPQTYKHLQIRAIMLSTTANHGDLTVNGDTGNNYAGHQLEGSGAGTPSASAGASRANMYSMVYTPGTTNGIGGSVIDILDYTNTNKYKTVRALRGADDNGSGNLALTSGLWMNTGAITSITLTARGGSFNQYSSFALYGIKG